MSDRTEPTVEDARRALLAALIEAANAGAAANSRNFAGAYAELTTADTPRPA